MGNPGYSKATSLRSRLTKVRGYMHYFGSGTEKMMYNGAEVVESLGNLLVRKGCAQFGD